MASSSSNKSHGGSRKVMSWQEKLVSLESETIISFVAARATWHCCGNKCMAKIKELQDDGVQMIRTLREARLAGT